MIVEKMTTMFVWIPRYAYSIVDGYQNKNANGQSPSTSPKIKVKFLVGNTNRDQEVAVGNGNGTSNSQQYAPTAETIVKSLPSKISWRYITIGESQYRCMQMANNTSAYGWTTVFIGKSTYFKI